MWRAVEAEFASNSLQNIGKPLIIVTRLVCMYNMIFGSPELMEDTALQGSSCVDTRRFQRGDDG